MAASHAATLKTVFSSMPEPWWNEDIAVEEDIADTDTERTQDAEIRRKRQGAMYKTFPNQAFVEMSFITLQVVGIIFIPCYIVIGLSLMGWVTSLESIMHEDPSAPQSVFEQTLVGDGSYDMHNVGVVYLIVSGLILILSSLTMRAVFCGQVWWIKLFLSLHFLVFITFELTLIAHTHINAPMGSCHLQLFRKQLQKQMNWYGLTEVPKNLTEIATGEKKERFLGYEAILKMNALQKALACCGVDGYQDYEMMNTNRSWFPQEATWLNYAERGNVTNVASVAGLPAGAKGLPRGRELDSIPVTCCKPEWRLNVYCAEGIREHTDWIKQRLNEQGCFQATQAICDNILYLVNISAIRVALLRLLFFIICLILLRYVLQMFEWEKIAAFDALLNMQRPNLEGFDLTDALQRFQPIHSVTQTLPGKPLSKMKWEQMLTVAELRKKKMAAEHGDDGTGAGPPHLHRRSSLWEDQARHSQMEIYEAKTREQLQRYSSLLKDELGEVPKDFDLRKMIEDERRGPPPPRAAVSDSALLAEKKAEEDAEMKTLREQLPGLEDVSSATVKQIARPKFRTMSTAIGRLAFSLLHQRRKRSQVHPAGTAGGPGPGEQHPIEETGPGGPGGAGATSGRRPSGKGKGHGKLHKKGARKSQDHDQVQQQLTPHGAKTHLPGGPHPPTTGYEADNEGEGETTEGEGEGGPTPAAPKKKLAHLFQGLIKKAVSQPITTTPQKKQPPPEMITESAKSEEESEESPPPEVTRRKKKRKLRRRRLKRKRKVESPEGPPRPRGKQPWDDYWWTGH